MAAPWEKFQDQSQQGPWSNFQAIKDSQRSKEATRAVIDADPISQGARAFPTEGNMVLPGAGSVVDKTIAAAKQMVPTGAPTTPAAFYTANPSQISSASSAAHQDAAANDAAERERRAVNAQLDQTAGGKIGKFAGEVGMLAPTSIIPGAASVRGSTLVGGASSALQPVTSDESRLLNTATGAGVAGGGATGIGMLAKALSGKLANAEAQAKILQEQNAPRDAIVQQARESGMVIPPSSVNPSLLNTTLESIGGKVGTERAASLTNQPIVNQLVREELGIQSNVPISAKTLEGIRKEANKAYDAVERMSPEAAEMVKALRQNRFEARRQQRFYDRSANPEAQDAAIAARERAAQLESGLEEMAAALKQPDLVQKMVEARRLIAKTHNVEDAITSSGNVDARLLGKSEYLTGNLKKVADVADQFPKAVQLPEKFGSTNVGAGKAFASALMGSGGGAALGPAGIAAAAIPFVAPPVARSVMFSKPMQNSLLSQNYGPSGSLMLANALASNPYLQRAAPALAIPYLPQMQQ